MRVANRSALAVELTAVLGTHGAEHWQRLIAAAGVPCGPINDISQAFKLATDLGLDPIALINKNGESVAQVANPVHYSATPVTYRLAPPTVGQDNTALIAAFGLA